MSDFNDRPLVAGSLIGLRAFKVDALGRLSGVVNGGTFGPGENVAACKSEKTWPSGLPDGAEVTVRSYSSSYFAFSPYTTTPISAVVVTFEDGRVEEFPSAKAVAAKYPPKEDPDHVVASKDCTCGFYAYFDGGNDYHLSSYGSTVSALVEGYGVCTVGDRGFRSTKARLVALIRTADEPDDVAEDEPASRLARLMGFAGSHRWNWGVVVLNALAMTLDLFTRHWILAGISGAIGAAFAVYAAAQQRSRKQHKEEVRFTGSYFGDPIPEVSDKRWQLVARNYPGVPIYPTVAAALAAHPLTPPEPEPLPSPETHEDFWSMEVPR